MEQLANWRKPSDAGIALISSQLYHSILTAESIMNEVGMRYLSFRFDRHDPEPLSVFAPTTRVTYDPQGTVPEPQSRREVV